MRRFQETLCLAAMLLLTPTVRAASQVNPRELSPAVPDLSCRCGSSAFLTIAHTNLSESEPSDQCFDYRILDARGTMEPQGVSLMFQNLVTRVLANQTAGLSQPIEYPAAVDQNTTSGQEYLLGALEAGMKACPDQQYILLGYSQGASLILEASSRFSQAALDAIQAIALVGNPYRIPGKAINVDSRALPDKRGNIGLFTASAISTGDKIPQLPADLEASGKVLDYCLENDTVCATNPACDCQIAADHLSYGLTETVQDTAFEHIVRALS